MPSPCWNTRHNLHEPDQVPADLPDGRLHAAAGGDAAHCRLRGSAALQHCSSVKEATRNQSWLWVSSVPVSPDTALHPPSTKHALMISSTQCLTSHSWRCHIAADVWRQPLSVMCQENTNTEVKLTPTQHNNIICSTSYHHTSKHLHNFKKADETFNYLIHLVSTQTDSCWQTDQHDT